SVVTFLFVILTGCKDEDATTDPNIDDPNTEMPFLSVTVPGLAMTDDILNVSVTKDSAIVIDYTITAPSKIQYFTQTVDESEETVSEAEGLEEFTGMLTIAIPHEEKTITLKLEVTDALDQLTTKTISIVVAEKQVPVEGGTPAFAFKATGF